MGHSSMPPPEVLILGAGVIGLSLALELRRRGLHVAVADRGTPLAQASTAAAGMLAVEDPYNPLALAPFSRLSGALYSGFLEHIAQLSGLSVPFQTGVTVQIMPDGSRRELQERSIDPRQLAPALLLAAHRAGVNLLTSTDLASDRAGLGNQELTSAIRVHASGAWTGGEIPVFPRKGQMLRVRIPASLTLTEVHRAEHIYVVPRTQGPQAGTALIGATVEDAGFDTTTRVVALANLRRLGAELVPGVGDENVAPMLEAWAGLRPSTPDGLPVLGELEPHGSRPSATRRFVAAGHFRNGILLAPATAVIIADLIEGKSPAIGLDAFSPARFACPAVAV